MRKPDFVRRHAQAATAADVIVEEQPGAEHPSGPQSLAIGQHESHRPDDVRRRCPENLALLQGVAHETECVLLEIAQTAVNKLG
jgi:hypothetical protein